MRISRYRTIQSLILPAMPKAANANYLRPKSDKQWRTRKLTWTTNSRIRDEFFYHLCFYFIMVKNYKIDSTFLRQQISGFYRVSQVSWDWVLLTLISSVPLSALLCLGWWEIGRSGWADGQDGGTQKSKSTQLRSQLTWDTLYMAWWGEQL